MGTVSLRLEQKLKVTQIQQLTIQLLTLRSQDLIDFLHEEVTKNPLVDIQYRDVRAGGEGREKPIENARDHADSLEVSLLKQVRLMTLEKKVLAAAGLIIQSLDERGFFTGALDELAHVYDLPLEALEDGLKVVQSLDPPGIGARTLAESLLLQTQRRYDVPKGTEELLKRQYDACLKGRWSQIEKALSLTRDDMRNIRDFLKTLSLQPVSQVSAEEVYIRPDIEIYEDEHHAFQVRSLEVLPEVYFRHDLYDQYVHDGDDETRSYVHRARRAFLDLQSALAYRLHSIMMVMTCIIAHQEGYLRHTATLMPLRQYEVAEETGLSTATVSRVCRNRYVLVEGRVVSVQSFFAGSFSSTAGNGNTVSDQVILQELKEVIDGEDPRHPYSDQVLAQYFQNQGISIARRTITKFRMKLRIPNSHLRRRLKE